MLKKEHANFLEKLQNFSYPDDANIANTIALINNEIALHKKPEKFEPQIDVAMMLVDNCPNNVPIQPEILICCLIGKELHDMPQDEVIEKYGHYTHEFLSILNEFPQDFNCDKMYNFFMQQDDDVQFLFFVNATHSLCAIEEDLKNEGYECGFSQIENFINLGMTVQDEESYPQLSQQFDHVSKFFIDYFENRADALKNNTVFLSPDFIKQTRLPN